MEGHYLPDLGRHGEEMEKLENKVEKGNNSRIESLQQDTKAAEDNFERYVP